MAELPRPGDSHGNLLWKIVINTFEAATGGGGGGVGPAGPAGAVGPQGPQGDPGTFPVGIESLADATAIWLTAAEDVGVGIAVPLAKLHVQVGDTTAVPSGAANTFVVEGTAANMGMTLLAGSGNNAFYAFGNEFAPAVSYVGYSMSLNQMWLATNDAIRMSINSTGLVGIGTILPEGRLHIFTASAGTITPETFADDLVIENSVFPGMSFLSPNDTVATIAFGDPQDSDAGALNYNHSVDVLSFKVGSLELVFFHGTTQRVGIGLPDPDAKLHVMTASAGAIIPSLFADELVLENDDHGGLTILTPNDKVATIYFGDPDNNDVGQISYNHAVDTLTLTAGTVNAVNIIATACNPGADNTISLGNAGNRWTQVFAVSSTINTSDEREKHAIEEIPGEFARYLVDKITPRSYAWNSESAHGTHYGFIAQEIEAVINARGLAANHFAPLHYDRENDRYGLRSDQLVPFLWRAVQDLSKRVTAIET